MPRNRLLAKREVATYAQVLLDAARQKGTAIEVSAQLGEIRQVILTHPGLRDVMTDGSMDPRARENVMTEVFPGADPDVIKVIGVMCERRDFDMFHRFIEEYDQLVEDDLNVVFIDITTVVELDDALRETIKNKFAAQFGKDIALREHVDASILGGIVLSAHGKRIDASVATQLDRVREALSTTRSGGER